METQTLIFGNLNALLDFLSITNITPSKVNVKDLECTGYYTEAQIELALNGMNARIKNPLNKEYNSTDLSESSRKQ